MSTNASKSYLISLLSGSEHGTFGYLAGGGYTTEIYLLVNSSMMR